MSANERPREGIDSSSDDNSQPAVRPHQDPDRLRELYHGEDLTQAEVGDRLNVDQSTISKYMGKYGIETEPPMDEREGKAVYRSSDENGKVQYIANVDGEPKRLVSEHQLAALLDYDAKEVFGRETHVHHLMAAPWAVDLPENLTVLNGSEHLKRHSEGTATDDPETVLQHVFDEFEPTIGSPKEN